MALAKSHLSPKRAEHEKIVFKTLFILTLKIKEENKLKSRKMKTDLNEYKEIMHDVQRALGSEKERLTERIEQLEGVMKMADMTDELLSQIDDLKDENERLNAENDRLRQEVQEKEMKLSELSKLSAGVARKSSQDEVLKALRTFVNKSKRKKYEKRVAIKEMVLELANANSIVFPEDLSATLESLDDEPSESKVVNVAGNYNDIHDNGSVNN